VSALSSALSSLASRARRRAACPSAGRGCGSERPDAGRGPVEGSRRPVRARRRGAVRSTLRTPQTASRWSAIGHRFAARRSVRWRAVAKAAKRQTQKVLHMTRFGTGRRVPTYGSDGTRTRGLRRDRPNRPKRRRTTEDDESCVFARFPAVGRADSASRCRAVPATFGRLLRVKRNDAVEALAVSARVQRSLRPRQPSLDFGDARG
jgi:hypothetical protein